MNRLRQLNSDADLQYLHKVSGGNPQMIQQFIDLFIKQTTEFIAEMNIHLDHNDWPKVASSAHKAKSSIAVMGLTEISKALESIELWIDEGIGFDRIPNLYQDIKSACQTAMEKLGAMRDAA